MTVQFTANNTTLISVSLTDRVRELCCLKLYTFDNATLRFETKVILDGPSKAKSVTGTIVHTRSLGKTVLKHFFKKCPLYTSMLTHSLP